MRCFFGRLGSLLFLCTLLSTGACSGPVSAQPLDERIAQRLQLAETFIRAGQFERAVTILEEVYEQAPESYIVYERLKQSLEGLKRYEDAIRLVERQMQRMPNPVLMTEKATLQYLNGDDQAAMATWRETLEVGGASRAIYRAVYHSMIQQRLFEQSAAILLEGRRKLNEPTAFQADIGYVYSIIGRHRDAAVEYVGLLEIDERQYGLVRSRLTTFATTPEARKATLEVIEASAGKRNGSTSLRELAAWLHTENGDFDRALEAYRSIEAIAGDGSRMLSLALAAEEAGSFDAALSAYEDVLRRNQGTSAGTEAIFRRARLHELRARTDGRSTADARRDFEAARRQYDEFTTRHPNHPSAPEAYLRSGRISLTVFDDLREASETFRTLADRFGGSDYGAQASFELASMAVRAGELARAKDLFRDIARRMGQHDLAYQARLELALLDFYEGAFDQARSAADQLQNNPSVPVANDAISLRLLLTEGAGPDSLNAALTSIATARLAYRRGHVDQALAAYEQLLTENPTHPLVPRASLEKARLLRTVDRVDEAVRLLSELSARYPQSPVADESLFVLGDIMERDRNNPSEAVQAYLRLLRNYPGSAFAGPARERVRSLQR
jgi:cellulose synthase operon protein C